MKPRLSVFVTKLVLECRRRELEAREEAANSRKYAAWQRSPKGKAKREGWLGTPSENESAAKSYDGEATFFSDVARILETCQ